MWGETKDADFLLEARKMGCSGSKGKNHHPTEVRKISVPTKPLDAPRPTKPGTTKPGALYSQERHTLRPLDLLLFAGEDGISGMIRFLQERGIESERKINLESTDVFSHVGIVVTSEILDSPLIEEGKIYVWESTISGRFGQNVQNVRHEDFLGVQLRNLDELFPAYDDPPSTWIAVCHLSNNPYDLAPSEDEKVYLKRRFTAIFDRLDGVRYDLNPVALASSIFPVLRPTRRQMKKILEGSGAKILSAPAEWLFCSELAATVYRDMGLYPESIIPDNVLPMDLIGYDIDGIDRGGLPCIFNLPPKRLVSDKYYTGDGDVPVPKKEVLLAPTSTDPPLVGPRYVFADLTVIDENGVPHVVPNPGLLIDTKAKNPLMTDPGIFSAVTTPSPRRKEKLGEVERFRRDSSAADRGDLVGGKFSRENSAREVPSSKIIARPEISAPPSPESVARTKSPPGLIIPRSASISPPGSDAGSLHTSMNSNVSSDPTVSLGDGGAETSSTDPSLENPSDSRA